MTDPIHHAPGIYFGLPAEDYHADPAASSSGLKAMLVSPLTAWAASPMNPEREDAETAAKILGSAYHTRVIEGAEVFARLYYKEPDRADYPHAIDGGAELRAKCEELGLPKSGTLGEMASRILDKDPTVTMFMTVVANIMAKNQGKTCLKTKDWREIERSAALIDAHPDASRALAGGWPEVSVFWDDAEYGIRCKARFDRLKMRAICDFKTFTNVNGKPVSVAVAHAVANYYYHVQAVFYMRALAAAKAMVAAHGMDCVHLPDAADAMTHGYRLPAAADMEALAAEPEHRFFFVFQEKGPAPNVVVRELARAHPGGGETVWWNAGEQKMREALHQWRTCLETFGPDTPWAPVEPLSAIADEDMPAWLLSA